MAMQHVIPDPLANSDAVEVQHVEVGAVGAIVKSEAEAQLDAAHRYRRSVTNFQLEAKTLATITPEVAEACIYSLPRDGKMITGPSVRLAEIIASSYGNLHVGARVVDDDGRFITAQGIAWDLEKNLRATIEVKRRITTKNGRRFSDDMVAVTGNAAASIALRNAIFRVVPRAYVDVIYEDVKRVAIGDARSLSSRRADLLGRLATLGVSEERVLARLDIKGVADIGAEQIEVLIGLGTAIKDGTQTLDEAFPEPAPPPAPPEADGKRMKLGKGKGNGKAKAQPNDEPPRDNPDDTPEREPGED